MNSVGIIHVVASAAAIATGCLVLLLPKGTRYHRMLGFAYVVLMVALNVSALALYRLTGTFGPFHVAAVASLCTVVPGFVFAHLHQPGWLEPHYFLMTFSYVGLLAAAASEVAVRLPSTPFWGAVVVASGGVGVVGAAFVFRLAGRVLSPFRAMSLAARLPRTSSGRSSEFDG